MRVCWDYTDFAIGTCPNQRLTTLTVVSDPLSISIGTDNTIQEGAAGLTYIKRYVVLVVDAAGNPKSDVQLSASVDLGSYLKGYYLYDAVNTTWVQGAQIEVGTTATDLSSTLFAANKMAVCPNEDLNRNGSIDGAEDVNGNGQLDPRKSDVAIAITGSTKTNTTGTAILQIEYPKSIGSWVTFRLSVAAAGVLSPPAYFPAPGLYDMLPVLASELKTETPPPSFVRSLYGQRRFSDGSDCRNPR